MKFRSYTPTIFVAAYLLVDGLLLSFASGSLVVVIFSAPLIGILQVLPLQAPWGGPFGLQPSSGFFSFRPSVHDLEGWAFASLIIFLFVFCVNWLFLRFFAQSR